MTFFPEPIRPSEGRQDDEYRVNPTEADKKGGESFSLEESEKKKQENLYGAFLVFLKTLIDQFNDNSVESLSEDSLINHVRELKALLEILTNLDQSESSEFCVKLSGVWNRLVEGIHIQSRITRKSYIDFEKLQALMTNMKHYPPNEDHNLGYYLGEYAGETWLPFPFREILKKLHVDHTVHKQNSVLSQWIEQTKDLLQS